MITGILIGLGIGVVLTGLYIWWQKKQTPSADLFSRQAQDALQAIVPDMIRAARDQLQAEKRDLGDSLAKDLRLHSDTFKEIAQALRTEINERQHEIRRLEEDRNQKYGQIAQALTDYKGLTEELRGSTEQLKRVLASNQLRGSWGELQAERILEMAGMVPGQHYLKQQVIEGHPNLRPDFTVLLPNKLALYIDVKFPLQSLQAAMASESKEGADRHMQQFGSDLRARLKEVARYVVGDTQSVDYVILFVPSERVFEMINRHFPDIVDACFGQRVILASPYSFFAVVRTIQVSYAHFYYEQNMKDILKYLDNVLDQFQKFEGEFTDVGRALASAQTKYSQIAETRVKQIARATQKIRTFEATEPNATLIEPVVIEETEPKVVAPE